MWYSYWEKRLASANDAPWLVDDGDLHLGDAPMKPSLLMMNQLAKEMQEWHYEVLDWMVNHFAFVASFWDLFWHVARIHIPHPWRDNASMDVDCHHHTFCAICYNIDMPTC